MCEVYIRTGSGSGSLMVRWGGAGGGPDLLWRFIMQPLSQAAESSGNPGRHGYI